MVDLETCRNLPKVELHVHLEGSVRPETVLKLAQRHEMPLPADTVAGLQEWYSFRDFSHFVEVYVAVSKRIKTADDVLLIGKEFVEGQARQNILHSEVTYTAATLEQYNGISWPDQLAALKEICAYARESGVSVAFILDIVRGHSLERANQVADWALEGHAAKVVCALGLAGEEKRGTKEYAEPVKRAESAGLPFIPHAGETCGPQVIWDCLEIGNPARLGHGVRCLEDPLLVDELRQRKTTLEVCPSSNVSLGVFPSLAEHPLVELSLAGLQVTVNSDDPPMFDTTLSHELYRCSQMFELDLDDLKGYQCQAAEASLAPPVRKQELLQSLQGPCVI